MRRTLRFAARPLRHRPRRRRLPCSAGAAPEGQIVIAQGADPTTLDPHMHAENFTFAVVHNVFDHLVRRSVKDGQLAHEPGLASSWTSVNPTTWEFKLRPGRQVPQRGGAERGGGEVQHRAGAEPRSEGALALGLRRHRAGRGRGPAHAAHRDQAAVPDARSRTSRTPCPSCRRSTCARRATPTWRLTRWARGRSSSSAGARTTSWCSRPTRRTGAARRRSRR